MTVTGVSILASPPTSGHIVFPYTKEDQFTEAVSLYALSGIERGESVLLVMTDDHCREIRSRLALDGLDVGKLEATRQLRCEDARRLLASFMVGNGIDASVFARRIGELISESRASSRSEDRPVRVFGEMVNLLWPENESAAHRLEELWNEVVKRHSISLLCTYDLSGKRVGDLPEAICDCHTHYVC